MTLGSSWSTKKPVAWVMRPMDLPESRFLDAKDMRAQISHLAKEQFLASRSSEANEISPLQSARIKA